ncbi:MAG TPA: galactose mutarotase [Minicystis sp.]|nr:galactose mutarotase [Minicystis sp.]
MFSIRDGQGPIRTLELHDGDAVSIAEIAPSRGGMLTRWTARGTRVLHLDEVSFLDLEKNVRGGVPILFPSPGKLSGGRWSRDGRGGEMAQHGFARNLPWDVVARGTDGAARATLRLASSDATLAAFPFRFALEVTYVLAGAKLRLDVRVANEGAETMPFGFGLHPYFEVPCADKPKVRIPTKATRAWDNVAKREVPFRGFDFGGAEIDLHLRDHGASEAALELPSGRVVVRGSPEFSHWVVWSVAGKDYVCLEPWTCPGDALNTGEGLLHVPPGAERALFVEIELVA